MIKTLRDVGMGFLGISMTATRLLLMGFSRIARLTSSAQAAQKPIWILGNGPSCQTVLSMASCPWDTEPAAVMAVNHFSDSPFFQKVKPTHYVISAPELLWLSAQNLKPMYVENRNRLFDHLAHQVNWDMELLVPARARQSGWWKNAIARNPHITIRYYSHLPVDGPLWFKHLIFGMQVGIPRPHNVVIPGIMSAIWLGFKDIRLLGVEHSWLPSLAVDDDNQVTLNHQHFYDQSPKIDTMNFEGQRTRKLHEVLEKFYFTFRSYWEIRDFSASAGVKITNFTPNSFIDAFPKKKI